MACMIKRLPAAFLTLLFYFGSVSAAGMTRVPIDTATKSRTTVAGDKSSIRRIIFGEQKIEGKIRRPQLVLIRADQRPEFPPMILQTLGKTRNIAALVDDSLIEAPHKAAFQFSGTNIINPAP